MRTFIYLALMHSTATSPLSVPVTIDSLTAFPVVPLLLVLSSVCSGAKHNITRRRKSNLSIAPHLLQSYDITTCVLASFQCHLGMAHAVRAFESKCANVVGTHDEFPCSRPSPRTCAYFLSSRSKPPASPPLLPSIRFPPFHPPFSRTEYFPLSVSLRPAWFLPKCQREGGSSPDAPRPSPSRLWCLPTWVRSSLLCSIRAPRLPRQ